MVDEADQVSFLMKIGRAGFVWLVCLLAIVSLSPFDVTDRDPAFAERVVQCFRFDAISIGPVGELVDHGVTFCPLGLLALVGWSRFGASWKRRLLTAIGVCIGPLVVIEFFQLIIAMRHAHVVDFSVNVFGVCVGAIFGVAIGPLLIRLSRVLDLRRRVVVWMFTAGVGVGFVAAMVVPALWLLSLDTWNCKHHLRLANETDRARLFHGAIGYVALFDRGLSNDEIAAWMSSNDREMEADDAVIVMDLARDCEGGIARMFWGDFVDCIPGKGLFFDTAKETAKHDGGVAFCKAAQTSDAFSVVVSMRSDDPDQDGPARIVTLSRTFNERNMTVGQAGETINFRVRHALSGSNGDRPACITTPVLKVGQWQRVVAVYDRGVSRVYVDSDEPTGFVDAHQPAVVLRAGIMPLAKFVASLAWVWPVVTAGRWRPRHGVLLGNVVMLILLVVVGWGLRWLLADHLPDWETPIWLMLAWIAAEIVYCIVVGRRGESGGLMSAVGEAGENRNDDVGRTG